MENCLAVRKYTDLKPFFETEMKSIQISLNNALLQAIDSIDKSSANSIKDGTLNTISNIASTITNSAVVGHQVLNAQSHYEAFLSPEARQALKDGTAKIFHSHKTEGGKFFPKIQFDNGKEEFLTLTKVTDPQMIANIAGLVNQMEIQQKINDIQTSLINFVETTNKQFEELRQELHNDRLAKVESAKLYFESYRKVVINGNDSLTYKTIIKSKINDAFAFLNVDYNGKMRELQQLASELNNPKNKFNSQTIRDKIQQEQENIKYIIEDTQYFQVLYYIELFLVYENSSKDTKNKNAIIADIGNKYIEPIKNVLSSQNLKLLSDLYVGDKNIWQDIFIPKIEILTKTQKELIECKNNVLENSMVAQ